MHLFLTKVIISDLFVCLCAFVFVCVRVRALSLGKDNCGMEFILVIYYFHAISFFWQTFFI